MYIAHTSMKEKERERHTHTHMAGTSMQSPTAALFWATKNGHILHYLPLQEFRLVLRR